MASVGIIANPAAGKDIRRLVAQGRFVPNQEKVNILKRILAGLDAAGVERVVMMPDMARLGNGALDGGKYRLDVSFVDMIVFNAQRDSVRAAGIMAEMGVGCIITLGGDGTNQAVAKGCGEVPLVPVSTGTNNVFPVMAEGTLAGIAAGLVAKAWSQWTPQLCRVSDLRCMWKVNSRILRLWMSQYPRSGSWARALSGTWRPWMSFTWRARSRLALGCRRLERS